MTAGSKQAFIGCQIINLLEEYQLHYGCHPKGATGGGTQSAVLTGQMPVTSLAAARALRYKAPLSHIHSHPFGSPKGPLTPTIMKLALSAIIAFVMLIWCSGCTTPSERSATSSVVTIQFVHPERFTDFSLQGRDIQYTAAVFTQRMTQALQPVMESRFPGGQLRLQFTDIDLAGRRFSMASPPARSSRSPRFSFNFALRDRSGRTLASGSQRLIVTERSSLSSNPNRSSRLTNESRTLARWLQFLSVTGR
jgi:Protein of unknown function (DUF3016)